MKNLPPHSQTPIAASAANNRVLETQVQTRAVLSPTETSRRLTPGEWLRAVEDFGAPFGFDRMPTVWG